MAVQVVIEFLLILSSKVASDWVEIPTVSVTRKATFQNVSDFLKSTTLSTPILSVFTEVYKTSPTSISLPELSTKRTLIRNQPVKTNSTTNKTHVKKSQLKNDNITPTVATKKLSADKNSKFGSVEGNQESEIIKETLKEVVESDLFNQPSTTVSQKLKYLQRMESRMSGEIRKLSQGLWSDRQARRKKLLGFASMEGALITIAFLTFAVFLVKVVHQFIQGLQNSELITVALPTAPALRLSRPKRQQRDFAAAQLLQYMDEFKIKHRICDSL